MRCAMLGGDPVDATLQWVEGLSERLSIPTYAQRDSNSQSPGPRARPRRCRPVVPAKADRPHPAAGRCASWVSTSRRRPSWRPRPRRIRPDGPTRSATRRPSTKPSTARRSQADRVLESYTRRSPHARDGESVMRLATSWIMRDATTVITRHCIIVPCAR